MKNTPYGTGSKQQRLLDAEDLRKKDSESILWNTGACTGFRGWKCHAPSPANPQSGLWEYSHGASPLASMVELRGAGTPPPTAGTASRAPRRCPPPNSRRPPGRSAAPPAVELPEAGGFVVADGAAGPALEAGAAVGQGALVELEELAGAA